MTSVTDLNIKAVIIGELAFRLKKAGDVRAIELFIEALKFEEEAAFLLPPEKESEPSRSILFGGRLL